MKRVGMLIVGMVLALVGCTAVAGGISFDGTSWAVTHIAGLPTIPAHQPTIEFSKTRISGTTGCNRYSAAYTADQKVLSISPVAMTQMACSSSLVMSQESRFTIALGKVASYRAEGTTVQLFDSSGTEVITLRSAPTPTPTADASLSAATWKATAISKGHATTAVVAGTQLTLKFSSDDHEYTATACGPFVGAAVITGSRITLGVPKTNGGACPTAAATAQRDRYIAVLISITAWKISGNHLTLSAPDGSRLEYQAT